MERKIGNCNGKEEVFHTYVNIQNYCSWKVSQLLFSYPCPHQPHLTMFQPELDVSGHSVSRGPPQGVAGARLSSRSALLSVVASDMASDRRLCFCGFRDRPHSCPCTPHWSLHGRGRLWPRLRESTALLSCRGPRAQGVFSLGLLWDKWLSWCVTRNTVT